MAPAGRDAAFKGRHSVRHRMERDLNPDSSIWNARKKHVENRDLNGKTKKRGKNPKSSYRIPS